MIINILSLSIFSILLAEFMLRIFKYLRTGRWELFALKLEKDKKFSSYESHAYIGYKKSKNVTNPKFPSNSGGFAGSKDIQIERNNDSDTIRIVVCGGSTVEQNDYDMVPAFDPELTWPKSMENNLNKVHKGNKFEVINAGCAGYTILESTIHLLTICIPYKPDYAILYQGINDAWQVQTVPGFKPDYTHARRHPNFPSKNKKGLLGFFPNIRLSFLYQYTLLFITRLIEKPPALLPYISRQYNYDMAFDQAKISVRTYEQYLRSFCGIALSNGITPILVPWLYKKDLISKLPNVVNNWDKEKFIDLLEMNSDVTRTVAKEMNGVLLFEFSPIDSDGFRSNDWIHFSKRGLEKIGKNAAAEFLKLYNSRA